MRGANWSRHLDFLMKTNGESEAGTLISDNTGELCSFEPRVWLRQFLIVPRKDDFR